MGLAYKVCALFVVLALTSTHAAAPTITGMSLVALWGQDAGRGGCRLQPIPWLQADGSGRVVHKTQIIRAQAGKQL